MKRNRQFSHYIKFLCDSKCLNLHHSYLKTYNFYQPDFFLLNIYIFVLPYHVKNSNKKGGHYSGFIEKTTTKGRASNDHFAGEKVSVFVQYLHFPCNVLTCVTFWFSGV